MQYSEISQISQFVNFIACLLQVKKYWQKLKKVQKLTFWKNSTFGRSRAPAPNRIYLFRRICLYDFCSNIVYLSSSMLIIIIKIKKK